MWDGRLIARRNLDDRAYLAQLQKLIVDKRWGAQPTGTPSQWAEQSFRLATDALVKSDTNIDQGYYRRHIGVVDERLALAGVRLAAGTESHIGAIRLSFRLDTAGLGT